MKTRTSLGSTTRRARAAVAAALTAFASVGLLTPPALALERDGAGWYHTGDGVVRKSVLGVEIGVFEVGHEMRCLPRRRSKLEVVQADCDKRLVWRMMRDVERDAIRATLRKAYKAVGYRDEANVARALAAFEGDLSERSVVTIAYDARRRRTTLSVPRASAVSVSGLDFMRATWRLVFDNEDLGDVGDALISKL